MAEEVKTQTKIVPGKEEVKATDVKEESKAQESNDKPVSKDSKEDIKAKKAASRRERDANLNWGIIHIHSSYNNTHLHVTDVTGSETITKVTGGMVSKSDRLKATPNVAMAASKEIADSCLKAGINALYVKLRGVGGHNGPMTPGPGAQASIRMLTRNGIRLGRIEDVTPVPHDSCRKSGGKRGRRV